MIVGDSTAALSPASGGVYLNVHAQPGARREEIRGMHGDALKVAVRQTPEEGRANAAIIELLASELGIARQDIELIAGQGSRRKRLFIRSDAERIAGRIEEIVRHA